MLLVVIWSTKEIPNSRILLWQWRTKKFLLPGKLPLCYNFSFQCISYHILKPHHATEHTLRICMWTTPRIVNTGTAHFHTPLPWVHFDDSSPRYYTRILHELCPRDTPVELISVRDIRGEYSVKATHAVHTVDFGLRDECQCLGYTGHGTDTVRV